MFPDIAGWQHTTLIQTNDFIPAYGGNIQILYDSRHHWVVVSNLSGVITVYDSLFTTLDDSVIIAIALIFRLFVHADILTIRLIRPQTQTGGTDCGRFAAAYSFILASGNRPEDYAIDQPSLGSWLRRWVERDDLTEIPRLDHVPTPVTREYSFPIICHCRRPRMHRVLGRSTICSKCKKEFHLNCVGTRRRQRRLCGNCPDPAMS